MLLDGSIRSWLCVVLALGAGCTGFGARAQESAASAPSTRPVAASGIEFVNVDEALAALKAKPGTEFRTEGPGWIIVKDGDAVWTFVPENHYAYPALVRRNLELENGTWFMRTRVLCRIEAACQSLAADYRKADARRMEKLRKP